MEKSDQNSLEETMTYGLKESAPIGGFILAQSSPAGASAYLNGPTTKKTKWTLHGLWPQSAKDWTGVECCAAYKPIIESHLSALEKDLSEFWPSYDPNKTNRDFWNYEYEKHGTCALNIEATNTVKKYFETSMDLLVENNMEHILYDCNFHPGVKYDSQLVRDTIRKEIGVNVHFRCAQDGESLYEVRICFDTLFRRIDCPKPGNCFRENIQIM
ncbi:hypothetical protein QAD02_017974 [Eretmocerus hayati]|uniref:Uncharacterized protein n=1 Tax=Eretmocerus hayati TaxID=131215 RepID=A0ACC2PIE9_9HYME|nr:hypothetical protein QAD02_017974 [Eretmocerus hayati]